MLTCLVPVLLTFYIQGVLKLKKNNSGAERLIVGLFNVLNCPDCVIRAQESCNTVGEIKIKIKIRVKFYKFRVKLEKIIII